MTRVRSRASNLAQDSGTPSTGREWSGAREEEGPERSENDVDRVDERGEQAVESSRPSRIKAASSRVEACRM